MISFFIMFSMQFYSFLTICSSDYGTNLGSFRCFIWRELFQIFRHQFYISCKKQQWLNRWHYFTKQNVSIIVRHMLFTINLGRKIGTSSAELLDFQLRKCKSNFKPRKNEINWQFKVVSMAFNFDGNCMFITLFDILNINHIILNMNKVYQYWI